MADRWDQHRISRDRKPIQALKLMLIFFAIDLAWEVLRANVNASQKSDWPWRFTVLDPSTCATLTALMAGILVTRSQYAQATLPILNWSAYPGGSDFVKGSLRTVRLFNAGGGRAIVKAIEYRHELTTTEGESRSSLGPWLGWYEFVKSIEGLGLRRPEEIFVLHLGIGTSIPLTTKSGDGIELIAFGQAALGRLRLVDIRIRIEDTLGDIHEKQLRCLRGDADPGGESSSSRFAYFSAQRTPDSQSVQ
ncbi:hypothetical protein [Phytohabitans rumicis]|uniref:Uncharacterized protein n=1 Tax=Phytohabitans rumicis TaxID=1076125 RepID=A0A6V8LLH9_9ACTN|nr:hypothetical protein [Phytohabitans rumicis]GFJ95479.1 hypothetical protein Prum_091210 [Phytohabitans rumicis]